MTDEVLTLFRKILVQNEFSMTEEVQHWSEVCGIAVYHVCPGFILEFETFHSEEVRCLDLNVLGFVGYLSTHNVCLQVRIFLTNSVEE